MFMVYWYIGWLIARSGYARAFLKDLEAVRSSSIIGTILSHFIPFYRLKGVEE